MRKKTIRNLPPLARIVAKLANEQRSIARRLQNLAKKINDDELSRYSEKPVRGAKNLNRDIK
jgi:hypothetical protein